MIKSGTVFFNDMYWSSRPRHGPRSNSACGPNSGCLHRHPDGTPVPRSQQGNTELLDLAPTLPDRVSIAHAPHAPYSVSRATLEHIAELAAADGRRAHPRRDRGRDRRVLERNGLSPIAYLDSLGLVGLRTILGTACTWTTTIAICSPRSRLSWPTWRCPTSLCSGFFEHEKATTAGCRIIPARMGRPATTACRCSVR